MSDARAAAAAPANAAYQVMSYESNVPCMADVVLLAFHRATAVIVSRLLESKIEDGTVRAQSLLTCQLFHPSTRYYVVPAKREREVLI